MVTTNQLNILSIVFLCFMLYYCKNNSKEESLELNTPNPTSKQETEKQTKRDTLLQKDSIEKSTLSKDGQIMELEKDTCKTIVINQNMTIDSIKICFDPINKPKWFLNLFIKNAAVQIVNSDIYSLDGYDLDSTLCSKSLCFRHFNNDNSLDFRLYIFGGSGGICSEIYLYNKSKSIFERSETLSSEYNLRYNRKTDIYQSSFRGGSCCQRFKRFMLKGDKIKILKEVDLEITNWESDSSKIYKKLIIGKDTIDKHFWILHSDSMDNIFEFDPDFRDFVNYSRNHNYMYN